KSLLIKLLLIVAPVFVIAWIFTFSSPLRDLFWGKMIETRENIADDSGSSSGEKNTLEDNVEKIVNSLSQEQMAGQLLMVGFDGKEPDYYVCRMINLRYVGGVVLFGRNIESKEQVTKLNNQLQKMSLAKVNLPLFIAVDQEGGPVNRFKGLITESPGPSSLGKLSGDDIAMYARDTAKELKAMGINVNLAPVLDVADNKSIMAGRAYGDDPSIVAKAGVAAMGGYKNGGIIPCAKHFPGLGLAVQDTHATSTKINSNMETLIKRDFIPFHEAIQNGVEMILINHAVYPALDSQNPASLSYTIQTDILRGMLGYRGLILSDDLEMEASESMGTIGQNAVRAFKAGADIVLVCHTPEKQREAYEALLAAIKSGEISEERLKLVLEATNDGYWDWNISTGKAYFSPRYYTMLCYEPDDFPADYKNLKSLIHSHDVEKTIDSVNKHFKNKEDYLTIEYRIKAKSGEWKWIKVRGKVVEWDKEGNPVRMVGTNTDINEQKEGERKLRSSEEKFSKAFNTSPDAMSITRLSDGTFLEINHGFTKLHGYTSDEIT
ncbi:MAG: beta-N-acetylhexosaminidase, partial [Clostridiales bacterium]|nr:beta-N-acetylhexosaminidase [Clostridiales bacterium]